MSEFSELLVMSSAALRADPDTANALLRKVQPHWAEQDEAQRRTVVLNAVEACVYSGPASLSAADVSKIIAPLLRLLPDDSDLDDFRPALAALLVRPGMDRSPILLKELKGRGIRRPPGEVETSDVAPTASISTASLVQLDFATSASVAVPRVGELPQGLTLADVSGAWFSLRDGAAESRRFEIDRWIIKSAALKRHRIDLQYADALRRDDAFWSDADTIEMAAALAGPFSEGMGELQAACLNTRLRFLRPRLFLQHPDTLVVASLGSRRDLEEAQDALFEEVSYPFLRSIRQLQYERRRGRAPRVTVLDEVERYLQDVLRRFGMRLVHEAGDEVQFDPSLHLPVGEVEIGDLVTVVEPGLVEIQSGLVRLHAKVTTKQSAQDIMGMEENESE